MARKVARKKTALAVGAIAACALPGALAGSSAPPKFQDCIKQATLGKCLAGDKLFGDTPDPDAVEGIKGILSDPLMIGRDDVHDEPTLGGGIKKFVRRAAGKPSAAVKKAALKKAARKKADAAAADTKLDAPKTLDDNDAQDDKEDTSTQDMTHTADDSHHEYPSDMSADEHAAEEESMKDKMSEIKAGFQGCDLSAIAQCMIDSDAQEAQAKGKEINDLIASPMWKSAPVECSYPQASGGKPSCEDFMKHEAKLALSRGRAPRRAQLGAELAQGQADAAYVAVIASVAAFAGYTVYQRRQQYESVPTNAGYGAM